MIDLELISEGEQRKIAKRLLPLIEDFYKNPENKKAFEEWKAQGGHLKYLN